MLKNGAVALPILEELHQQKPDDLDLARALAEAHVKHGSGDQLLTRLSGRTDAVGHYLRGLVLFSRAADAGAPAAQEPDRRPGAGAAGSRRRRGRV